jgi:hypothetical protein
MVTPGPVRKDERPPVWFDNASIAVSVAVVTFVLGAIALTTYRMMSDPSAPSGAWAEILQMVLTVGIGGACFYGTYRVACWATREWRRPGP